MPGVRVGRGGGREEGAAARLPHCEGEGLVDRGRDAAMTPPSLGIRSCYCTPLHAALRVLCRFSTLAALQKVSRECCSVVACLSVKRRKQTVGRAPCPDCPRRRSRSDKRRWRSKRTGGAKVRRLRGMGMPRFVYACDRDRGTPEGRAGDAGRAKREARKAAGEEEVYQVKRFPESRGRAASG